MGGNAIGPLQVGLVGYGDAARRHAEAYAFIRGLEVRAACDIVGTTPRADSGLQMYDGLDAMLGAVALDVLDICTPPRHHLEVIVAAISAGCDVVCEKPVLDWSEIDSFLELMRGRQSVVWPCHNYRFAPGVGRLREAVVGAELGRPIHLKLDTLRTHPAPGASLYGANWRRADPPYGGILADHGSHAAYIARFILGVAPNRVRCTYSLSKFGDWMSDDIAYLQLAFGDVVASAFMSWRSPVRLTRYELRGSTGTMAVRPEGTQPGSHGIRKSDRSGFSDARWYVPLLKEARDAIRDRKQEAGVASILYVAEVLEAARRSADSGGVWVNLPLRRVCNTM